MIEVYVYIIGKVDIKEKFEVYCLEMVECEWVCMKVNNLKECCNCYNFDDMDFI